MIGHALLAPGLEVVVSQYCFAVYPIVTALFGARLVTVPAKRYGHDLEAMLAAMTPNTRAVFVANPNNLTGTAVGREDLARSSTPCRTGSWSPWTRHTLNSWPAGRFLPESSGGRANLILMRTFSKIYGLAGLRTGYGIGHPEFVAGPRRFASLSKTEPNRVTT